MLTKQDRCDRCSAQAFHITRHDAGLLMWCSHHYRQHWAALMRTT